MSTITKERIELFIKNPLENGLTRSEQMEVARIALASLEADPIGEVSEKRYGLIMDGTVDLGGKSTYRIIKGEKAMKLFPLWTKFYTAPPAPASVPDYPETLPCPVMLEPGLKFGKGVPTRTMLGALRRRAEYYAELEAMTPEQRAEHDTGMKEFAAMLQGAEQQNRQQNIPENIPATQFKPVADLYGLTSPTGSETSFTFDAVEARDFIDGGWSCQEYVELERFQEAITNHTEDKLAMVDHSGDSNNMVEPVTTAYKLPDDFICMLTGRAKYLREKGEIKSPELLERAAAALQGESVNTSSIPNGWKLVPIDPTKDMLRAGQSVVGFWLNTVHCYSKMLAAAPAAPQQEA